MCKNKIHFTLCTCLTKETTQGEKSFKILWKLNRFVKHEWIGMDGMVIEPIKMFTHQITHEFIKEEMNARNCFDFDYNPEEGDSIILEYFQNSKRKKTKKMNQPKNGYMSFIFKKDQWIIENYNPFYDQTQELNKGLVKIR